MHTLQDLVAGCTFTFTTDRELQDILRDGLATPVSARRVHEFMYAWTNNLNHKQLANTLGIRITRNGDTRS